MKKKTKEKIRKINRISKDILSLAIIIFLFILSSLFIQNNQDKVRSIIGTENFIGILIYLLILILSIVFIPVSAMPLMPLASALWGWFFAGLLAIIGWTIGSIIAFWIAKEYGKPLVKRLIPMEKIEKFGRLIPDEHLFITVVFLTMVFPFDGLSYILGLFTKMKTKTYLIATILGLIPFSFVFSYLGTLSIAYQIAGFLLATLILIISILRMSKIKNKNKN